MGDNFGELSKRLRGLEEAAKDGPLALSDVELCRFADAFEEVAEALHMLGDYK